MRSGYGGSPNDGRPLRPAEDVNPVIEDTYGSRPREVLFTPPATRNTICMPGDLGQSNWGKAGGDPPAMHLPSRGAFAQHCEGCSGAVLAQPSEEFQTIVCKSRGQMPAFNEIIVSPQDLAAGAAYRVKPAAGAIPPGGGRGLQPQIPPPPPGQTRNCSPYCTLDASNQLPAIGPAWSEPAARRRHYGRSLWQGCSDGSRPSPPAAKVVSNCRGQDLLWHLINVADDRRIGGPQRLQDFSRVEGIQVRARSATRPKRVLAVPEMAAVAFDWNNGASGSRLCR
jgi:hypothetical protein